LAPEIANSSTISPPCLDRTRSTNAAPPTDRLNRILTAVETIEESLDIFARKQQVSRPR
jgi:hypothetical protein